jgi:hypothetical protein
MYYLLYKYLCYWKTSKLCAISWDSLEDVLHTAQQTFKLLHDKHVEVGNMVSYKSCGRFYAINSNETMLIYKPLILYHFTLFILYILNFFLALHTFALYLVSSIIVSSFQHIYYQILLHTSTPRLSLGHGRPVFFGFVIHSFGIVASNYIPLPPILIISINLLFRFNE